MRAEEDFDAIEAAVLIEELLGGGDIDPNPTRVPVRGDALNAE